MWSVRGVWWKQGVVSEGSVVEQGVVSEGSVVEKRCGQ